MAENGNLPSRMMNVSLGNPVILTEQLTAMVIREKQKSVRMEGQRKSGIIPIMAHQEDTPIRMITILIGKEIIQTGGVPRIIRKEMHQSSRDLGGT